MVDALSAPCTEVSAASPLRGGICSRTGDRGVLASSRGVTGGGRAARVGAGVRAPAASAARPPRRAALVVRAAAGTTAR